MSDTITLPLFNVLIDTERGSTTLSIAVPKHEVEVLRVVHNGRVRVGEETGDEIELNVNADAEFSRLQRRYRRLNDKDPVRFAFHAGAASLKAFGFDLGRGNNEAAPQAGIRKHPKPAKAEPKKAKAE